MIELTPNLTTQAGSYSGCFLLHFPRPGGGGRSMGTELVSVQEGESKCRQAELQGQAHLDLMLAHMHVDLLSAASYSAQHCFSEKFECCHLVFT